MSRLQAALPLSLYIHIPFCVRKCPYCDFYSLAGSLEKERAYRERLMVELRLRRDWIQEDPRPIHSIFIGGGTPSLLHPETIRQLLQEVENLWTLEPDCEITLEANPESCTADKITGWLEAGINRVSLGVQAVSDQRLHLLGRPHDRAMALDALRLLQQGGVDRINVDLIHTTPGQTWSLWHEELGEVVSRGIDHLSCYALTVEPGTGFARLAGQGNLVLPDEEEALEFFQKTRLFLTDQGFIPYEISNFARPGQECRHNVNYWEFGDYLGIGASAHGKWTDPDDRTWRTVNGADLTGYLTQTPGVPEWIPAVSAGMECLMMGLRQWRGLDLERHRQVAGVSLWSDKRQTIDNGMAAGWFALDGSRLRVTESGVRILNALLLELI